MNPEYHLFIIWENARHQEDRILSDIDKEFEILFKVAVKWRKKNFANNLTRFYGTNLPENSEKEKHIGTGEFLVVVVRDDSPNYQDHITSNGEKCVNSRTFLAKLRYREMTDGGHKVHGTNTKFEFSHDFMLLFGASFEQFTKKMGQHPLEVIKHRGDVIGHEGWDSLRQVLDVLNHTSEYVVMRNFEPLPDSYYAQDHGDIDFLVRDYEATRLILNAKPVFTEPNRVHNKISISGDDVFIDLRYVGDGYYDEAWQEEIIKRRRFLNGMYVMSHEDHFYSLLYHALIHKPLVAEDYISTLNKLSSEIKYSSGEKVDTEWFQGHSAVKCLADFLASKHYSISLPEESVYFNHTNAQKVTNLIKDHKGIRQLKKQFNFDTVELFESVQKDERRFYKAKRDDEHYFVKSSSVSYESEFKFSKRVFDKNNYLFAEPVEYKKGKINYFVSRWVEGKRLDDYISDNKLTKTQKNTLIKDLGDIANCLWSEGIVHRDIIPRNFMVTREGRLVLIDFFWAVDITNYREYEYVQSDIEHIRFLGEDFSPGEYKWDDSYSFMKIAGYILGGKEISPSLKDISSRIGKRVIVPDIGAFQASLEEQKQRNIVLQKKAEKLQRQYSELQKHNEELTILTTRLSSSLSWRITKPLRALRGLFN